MLKLTVVTPEKRLVTDVEVDDILLPAFRGELNILDGHAPLMTTLTAGVVQFKRKGSTTTVLVAVSWGYCEIANNIVNILAETAERPDEIDVPRAEESLKKSESEMGSNTDPEMIERNRLKRERAQVRIAVARMNH
jgi:F-type H+-transporting ATPase subunit epsilon